MSRKKRKKRKRRNIPRTLKGYNRHHIIPKSKGGKMGRNLIIVPKKYHRLYHIIFSNRKPNGALVFLKRLWNNEVSLKASNKIQDAYHELFYRMSKDEVLVYLYNYWWNWYDYKFRELE